MRQFSLLLLGLLLAATASAQTQQGFVKTKGRMVNGQHVPGQGLQGATVSVQGRTPVVVQNSDGSFSFPIPAQTFMFQSVQKNGYELVDVDALKKSYNYSTNPIYLVMETPEQQTQDLLESERKIRRTLQRRLQQREDELEALKEANRITLEEYQQSMQRLYADQQNNEQLISDMAKEYAQMDYDQMNELNQRISDAILNGRLTEADSLLRSKGDMKSRIAEIKREQQAEAQREAEIIQEQASLDEAKAGTQKRLVDIASDCYKFFDLCKLNMQWDSAAYYIEIRAELDTTNADWQFEAANYFLYQNDYGQAEKFYSIALDIYKNLANDDTLTYAAKMSAVMNNLAFVLSETQRFAESESLLLEVLETLKHGAKNDSATNEPALATTQTQLANLYSNTQRYAEAETMYLESLDTWRKLAKGTQKTYEHYLSFTSTLDALALLYNYTHRLPESEALFLEALQVIRPLAKDNPKTYNPQLSLILHNLAIMYLTNGRYHESEALFLETLEVIRPLAKENPKAHKPALAKSLSGLAAVYSNTHRFTESKTLKLEALEIYRQLAKENPKTYEPELAKFLNGFAISLPDVNDFSERESLLLESLGILRRLVKENPQAYEETLALSLCSLSIMYYETQQFPESETLFLENLPILRKLAEFDPQNWETSLIYSLNSLAYLYLNTQHFSKSEVLYLEELPLIRQLAKEDPVYETDLVGTLYNVGLLYIQQKQYSQAIPYFEETLAICHDFSSNNLSVVSFYHSSLHWLSQLYSTTSEHTRYYELNEEWLPILKTYYQEDAESNKGNYSSALINQSFQCIFLKKFEQAEQYAREALQIDDSKTIIYTNLAAALLFQGKYDEAEQIYIQYKDKLRDGFLQDLADFEAAGIIPEERKTDVERIKKMLNE